MPNISIEGPILKDLEIKRVLIKEITDVIEKAYKIPREHIIITIKGILPENVAIGGQLIADRRKVNL